MAGWRASLAKDGRQGFVGEKKKKKAFTNYSFTEGHKVVAFCCFTCSDHFMYDYTFALVRIGHHRWSTRTFLLLGWRGGQSTPLRNAITFSLLDNNNDINTNNKWLQMKIPLSPFFNFLFYFSKERKRIKWQGQKKGRRLGGRYQVSNVCVSVCIQYITSFLSSFHSSQTSLRD